MVTENEQITCQYIENLNTTIDQTLLFDKLSKLSNEDTENSLVEGKLCFLFHDFCL